MKRLLIITLIIVGLLTYTAFNVWFFGSGGQGLSTIKSFLPFRASQVENTSASPGFPISQPVGQNPLGGATLSSLKPTQPLTPTPTPTPLQGPGRYACDPYGVCNDYSDEMRKDCPATFADPHCLNQCDNPTKRCTQ